MHKKGAYVYGDFNYDKKVIAEEEWGTTNTYGRKYITHDGAEQITIAQPNQTDTKKISQPLTRFFRDVFLPQGYPDSVSNDYIQYQIWDSLQSFFSSITGSLSTRAVLKGVGVGNEAATVTSATLTWLLKDGSGMIGGILFTWKKGTQLDTECKKFRLFADLMNDSALCLNLVSPLFPHLFTVIMCISGVMLSLVGVAGGATRAALTQHQARANNMADVSAKDGSQETLVNLVALICSLVIIPIVAENVIVTWLTFATCTILHLYCNYKAVTSVCMNTFNKQRFEFAFLNYIQNGEVNSVESINSRETVWVSPMPQKVKVNLGVSLSEILSSKSHFKLLTDLFSPSGYLLDIKKGSHIFIALHRDSDVKTQMEALFHASLIKFVITTDSRAFVTTSRGSFNWQSTINELLSLATNVARNKEKIIRLTRSITSIQFRNFLENAKLWGWNTDYALFGSSEWRSYWDVQKYMTQN